jgi:hypothetical protein
MRMDPSLRVRPRGASSKKKESTNVSGAASSVVSRSTSRATSRSASAFAFTEESLAQLANESRDVANQAITPRSLRASPPPSTRGTATGTAPATVDGADNDNDGARSTTPSIPLLDAEQEAKRQQRIAHKRTLSMRSMAARVEKKKKEREVVCTDFIFNEQRRSRQRKQIKQLCKSISTMTNPDQVKAVRQEYRGTSMDYGWFSLLALIHFLSTFSGRYLLCA